jgi:hypothetical protein
VNVLSFPSGSGPVVAHRCGSKTRLNSEDGHPQSEGDERTPHGRNEHPNERYAAAHAAEALALLDPQQPQNRLALKLTLKDLVARRVLRVEQRPAARGKTETYLLAGPDRPAQPCPHAQVVR